mgnify:FL=1
MSQKQVIIKQLEAIWLKLKGDKENFENQLDSNELNDQEKEDLKSSLEGATMVYNAHVKNVAMNVKNNFYSWSDVDEVNKELAVEIEKLLQE